MVRAGHLRYLILVLPAVSGCGYLKDRLNDLGDIVRIEGSVGIGAQVRASAGELAHVGFGSSKSHSAGWRYGHSGREDREEDFLPLSFVRTLEAEGNRDALHSLRWTCKQKTFVHRCPMAFAGELHSGNVGRPALHYFNIEAGVFALLVGAEAGFSLGELVDFLLGLATIDIGEDDGDLRETRRTWKKLDPEEP